MDQVIIEVEGYVCMKLDSSPWFKYAVGDLSRRCKAEGQTLVLVAQVLPCKCYFVAVSLVDDNLLVAAAVIK